VSAFAPALRQGRQNPGLRRTKPDLVEIAQNPAALRAPGPTPRTQIWTCAGVTANYAVACESGSRLFDGHFVRKQESGCTVVELYQQHMAPEIVHLTQNARFFAIPAQPFLVAYRLEQTTTPPNHRLPICTFHVHICPSTRQAPPPAYWRSCFATVH
jgi:hypothetical protein